MEDFEGLHFNEVYSKSCKKYFILKIKATKILFHKIHKK